jgi:hypothetical protein
MERSESPLGGEFYRLHETPRWPRYIGALALDAWLARVAAYETAQPPSVELFIAQYPGEETEQAEIEPGSNSQMREVIDIEAIQLPLHLQWGDESVPADLCEKPLTPADAEAARRILTTAVNIFAGRTSPFSLFGQLDDKVYAALETRLRIGTRLPPRAELRRVHGQYPSKGFIEACGVAATSSTSRAIVARLERKRRRWLGTELRVV